MRSNITWTCRTCGCFCLVFYRSLDPPIWVSNCRLQTDLFLGGFFKGLKISDPNGGKKRNQSKPFFFFGIQSLWLSFQIPEIEWVHDGPNGQVMTSRLRQDGFALAPYWEASSLHGDTFDLRLEESDQSLGEPHHMWKHHEASLFIIGVNRWNFTIQNGP